MNVGLLSATDDAVRDRFYFHPPLDLASVFPDPTRDIFLGSDPEDADLVARLQAGSIDDQIAAVSELTIDPAGLNAAYRVYTQTASPAVRMAVLDLIEGEDNYLARSMIVMSLQSLDPAEVIHALSIVDAQDDFSLAPQLEALQGHHDAGVRESAREVLQSITSDYDETGTSGSGTLLVEPPGPVGSDGGIERDDMRK